MEADEQCEEASQVPSKCRGTAQPAGVTLSRGEKGSSFLNMSEAGVGPESPALPEANVRGVF